MRKEDEEFLERVRKEEPELAETNADRTGYEKVLKQLIHAAPEPKKKRSTQDAQAHSKQQAANRQVQNAKK